MQVDLTGRVALVTGAARGIGQAIANSLSANGARVVYSDLDRAAVDAAASQSIGCVGMVLNVTDPAPVSYTHLVGLLVAGVDATVAATGAGRDR